jgi:hypothetical protein
MNGLSSFESQVRWVDVIGTIQQGSSLTQLELELSNIRDIPKEPSRIPQLTLPKLQHLLLSAELDLMFRFLSNFGLPMLQHMEIEFEGDVGQRVHLAELEINFPSLLSLNVVSLELHETLILSRFRTPRLQTLDLQFYEAASNYYSCEEFHWPEAQTLHWQTPKQLRISNLPGLVIVGLLLGLDTSRTERFVCGRIRVEDIPSLPHEFQQGHGEKKVSILANITRADFSFHLPTLLVFFDHCEAPVLEDLRFAEENRGAFATEEKIQSWRAFCSRHSQVLSRVKTLHVDIPIFDATKEHPLKLFLALEHLWLNLQSPKANELQWLMDTEVLTHLRVLDVSCRNVRKDLVVWSTNVAEKIKKVIHARQSCGIQIESARVFNGRKPSRIVTVK